MKQNTKLSLKVLRALGLLLGVIFSVLITLVASVVENGSAFIGWALCTIFFITVFVRDVVKLLEYVERHPKKDGD